MRAGVVPLCPIGEYPCEKPPAGIHRTTASTASTYQPSKLARRGHRMTARNRAPASGARSRKRRQQQRREARERRGEHKEAIRDEARVTRRRGPQRRYTTCSGEHSRRRSDDTARAVPRDTQEKLCNTASPCSGQRGRRQGEDLRAPGRHHHRARATGRRRRPASSPDGNITEASQRVCDGLVSR